MTSGIRTCIPESFIGDDPGGSFHVLLKPTCILMFMVRHWVYRLESFLPFKTTPAVT